MGLVLFFFFFISSRRRRDEVSLLPSFSPSHSNTRLFSKPTINTVWISGTLQTGLYLDFFYYYYLRAWRNNEKLSLPS